MSVFTGDRINRATFGYSHANFTAMFIVLEILLMYFRIKK
ncbi:putative membrane protein [[Clostridium] sordellii ATCC 9714]|nr:putative membrane protein [[Clostridium] sordellii ATCC 9714] [Paeniclostridium sordellii ATCC 9714]